MNQLAGLKVGDKVLISYHGAGRSTLDMGTVKKFTKTGNIKLRERGDSIYNVNTGRRRGDGIWSWETIEPYDQQAWERELLRRQRSQLLRMMQDMRWQDLTTAGLLAVAEVIKAERDLKIAEEKREKAQAAVTAIAEAVRDEETTNAAFTLCRHCNTNPAGGMFDATLCGPCYNSRSIWDKEG